MNALYQTCKTLTLAGASAVRDRAAARASTLSLAIAIVVVDRSGALLLVEVADGAAPGAIEAALMKAKGALSRRHSSDGGVSQDISGRAGEPCAVAARALRLSGRRAHQKRR